MRIGVPREIHAGERRVAATPDTAKRLIALGFEVTVEVGAGQEAGFPDALYVEAGAAIETDAAVVWSASIVIKVLPPEEREGGSHEADLLGEGTTLVSLVFPAQNEALVERLAARKVTLMALDCVPRISRAQKMDVLSSMANIAGYRAVVEAANAYGALFGGQITAAGKSAPARVMIIGAGVAGLAAIAAARGLGAIVSAFDTRPAVKEQVESLGASFLELEFEESGEGGGGYAKVMSKEFIAAEMALFREQAAKVDVIITTALIPGKPAPKLILHDMVELMKPGSVIVDLAAANGGNCELTKPGEVAVTHGVTIIGYTDLTSRLPRHASQMFSTNLYHLLAEMGGGEGFVVDEGNDAVCGALVLLDGALKWPAPKIEPSPQAAAKPKPKPEKTASTSQGKRKERVSPPPPTQRGPVARVLAILVASIGIAGVAYYAPAEFVQHFTVFVLACFIGWQVVWSVSPALHTPLMSVTNAISGIIIVGGILKAATGRFDTPAIIGGVAVLFAMINVVGGFLVTQRMLKMFRR